MNKVFGVADILIDHALLAHPGEIAIIAYHGSHAKGTASSTSDLDIFYIPDEGKAQSLSSQFVLDGRQFANSILNSLALVNQTYFTKGWGANLTQAMELPQKPADLAGRIGGILLSQDATRILEQAEELALDVRRILHTAQISPGQPADARQAFKDFYPFVFEYKNKVLAACELEDALAAGYAAYQLDEAICMWLDRHGVDLNSLNSEDDLRAFLNRRDPVR